MKRLSTFDVQPLIDCLILCADGILLHPTYNNFLTDFNHQYEKIKEETIRPTYYNTQ